MKTKVYHYILIGVLTLLAAILIMLYSNYRLAIFIIYCIVISIFFINQKHQQKQNIIKLYTYLQDLNRCIYRMDIESYSEGDLSILQSELYKTTITIREKNSLLQDQQKFLNQALADIAHQLKTPITSIVLMLDLMEQEVNTESQQLFYNNAHSQVQRLTQLIERLLTLVKLEAKSIIYHLEDIEDYQFIHQIVEHLNLQAEQHQLKYVVSTSNKIIKIDPFWMQEAIINIMNNALRYAYPKTIIFITSNVDAFNWTLSIENKGDTIDTKDLKKLFDRFYKGKNETSESVGIGLAMTKAIVNGHNGTVEVDSTENTTRFTIIVPLTK